MKQEANNEMDLLLRRLGRQQDAPVSTTADHLDADELSAYAENVLPAAARARYTEHLAECSHCREIVAQFSSAAGVVTAPETVGISAPSTLRKFLASLFSPMVLRYAVPALGLIVVAAIGVLVLRRQNAGELVTQVRQVSPTTQNPQATPAPSGDQKFYDSQEKAPATQNGRVNKEAETTKSAAAPPPPNSPPVVGSVNATVSPDAANQKAAEASVANEPPPPKAAPKPTPTDEKKTADTETTKKEVQELPTMQPSATRGQSARREDRPTDEVAASERARPAKSKAPSVGALAGVAKVQRDADKQEKDDTAETRTIAGRSFRKESGIWIDTAYDSSRSTINIARGSEQYRALVADEPTIKTIADQLDGEFIVVWKRRAYRIR